MKVVTKKCIALEHREGLPFKAYIGFLLGYKMQLSPHWKVSCVGNQVTVCKGLGARSLLLCISLHL